MAAVASGLMFGAAAPISKGVDWLTDQVQQKLFRKVRFEYSCDLPRRKLLYLIFF
jgi:hypothetical protein